MMFACKQCGACCRHLSLSPLYRDLDRGDGVCRHLKGNLCGIYPDRPLICRVEEGYEAFFREKMTHETYEQVTHEACEWLRQLEQTGQ